jgi:hypothetical protein
VAGRQEAPVAAQPRPGRALDPGNVALVDQILAALADAPPRGLATWQVAEQAAIRGADGRPAVKTAYRLLEWLRRRGEVAKESAHSCYCMWRRLTPLAAIDVGPVTPRTPPPPRRRGRDLSEFSASVTEQNIAVLEREAPLPVSTSHICRSTVGLGYQNTVLRLLNRLAQLSEIEKIKREDQRCLYWRRLPVPEGLR